MDITIIEEYLEPTVLILIPALWLIGYFLKQSPKIPNWLITWLLLALGITASLFLVSLSISGIIQGVLATGLAVLGYDLYKQTIKK